VSTVLIVGGAGFLGCALVAALLRRADTVRVLDNVSTGSLGNLRLAALRGTREGEGRGGRAASRLDVIVGDVRDPGVVRKAVRGATYVLHHAEWASRGGSARHAEEITSVNVGGTLNVLRAAKAEGVRRVVYASNWSVYGCGRPLPLSESLVLAPASPYAASKAAAEAYCHAYWEAYRLETVCLRYFNVYGPFQKGSAESGPVVPRFINAMLEGVQPTVYGDGQQTRDFIFVDDAVRATLAAVALPNVAGRCVNVASGCMTSIRQVWAMVSAMTGNGTEPRFAPARPCDVRQSLGDTTLAQTLLNCTAEVSLADGFARTVEHFRETIKAAPETLARSVPR